MPLTVITGLVAVICYLMGVIFQSLNIAGNRDTRNKVLTFGTMAVVAHAISAFGVIRTTTGYHFGISEISTLIAMSISLLVIISSFRKPLENLFLGLFPLAIAAIIASLTISSNYPPTSMSAGLASHVLLSILAYSIITIAAMQSAFLAFQNYRLKHKHAGGVIKRFPPLQDMESFLFELLWVGEILLALSMLAGVIFFQDVWGQEGIIHKAFFSSLAWLVFAGLLWGRHVLGWRGTTAIRGTLTGFIFLILGFYGSKFALEYIFA